MASQPSRISVSVADSGQVTFDGVPVANDQALMERLRQLAAQNPQPELQLEVVDTAHFAAMNNVLYGIMNAGFAKEKIHTPGAK